MEEVLKPALLNKSLIPKQDIVLRVLGAGSGVGLMVLTVFTFMMYPIKGPFDVILPVYYFLFGFLMLLSELRLSSMIVYWRFLFDKFTKGMFYIFAGTLCIRGTFFLNYLLAAVCIIIGSVIACCRTVKGIPQVQDPPDS